MPLFSVSLGLAIDRRPVLGVVEAPALGWTFAGTTHGRRVDVQRQADRAVADDRLAGALLVTGFPYQRNPVQNNMAEFAALTAAAQGTRRLGSAALDLCFVACGWLDGYWERALHAVGSGGRRGDRAGRGRAGDRPRRRRVRRRDRARPRHATAASTSRCSASSQDVARRGERALAVSA